MKIRLKVSLSGSNFSYHEGQEADVDAEIAKQWIEADYAEAVHIAKKTKQDTETE